jgi:hypothetical protein
VVTVALVAAGAVVSFLALRQVPAPPPATTVEEVPELAGVS